MKLGFVTSTNIQIIEYLLHSQDYPVREYRKQAKIIRAKSHPGRLRILDILAQRQSCVSDLMSQIHERQASITQQLMTLRRAGMVKGSRLDAKNQYELTQPETTKNMPRRLL